ncbi:MAG TPA: hypothetical protein VM261_30985 [Kofleriaceae bacterium]|nr:hypothetical protein [Kofleriaceae bacterium]
MKLYVVTVGAAAAAFASLVACGGDGPDCGGGACQACVVSNPFDCTGDTICLDDVCQPAFGRSYVFTVTTGTLPSVDDMGASWDESGGLPDPFVELTIDGTTYRAPTITDSTAPAWNYDTPAVTVAAGTSMRIRVYEDDEPTDAGAWVCVSDPIAVEYLRSGGFGCSGPGSLPGARVNVTVTPQ